MGNKISMQELISKSDNIYKIVRAAAVRAKDLNLGGKSFLDKPTSKNYATIALQEIVAGRVKIVDKEEAEKIRKASALNIFGDGSSDSNADQEEQESE